MDKTAVVMEQFYQRITRGEHRSEFDKIGFFNIGYWKGVEDSVEVAQINLIETLLEFFARTGGTVLDAACGKGASTKFLTKYFDPENITGINIAESQLQICRTLVPECKFELMDATKLEFSDSTFDNVLCIEAAQHFRTRYRFLEEAHRVLTPGGRLAMHDLVFHNRDRLDAPNVEIWPKENYMPNLDIYRDDLKRIGFGHVRVEDITEFSMVPALKCLIRKAERELGMKQNHKSLEDVAMTLKSGGPWMPGNCSWCMAYAIK